jgi:elongation factor G
MGSSYTTADIRNLVLVGSARSGKTTLVEVMLHDAGAIGRIGRVEDKNTVCDFEDLEKEMGHSIDSAIVNFDYGGAHINLIDTPGRGDFLGKAMSCYPAVETVVLVLDAESGIDPVVRRLVKLAEDRNLPRMIVINKIDHEGDVAELVEAIQEALGSVCRPVNLPTNGGKAVIDCFTNATGSSDIGDVADFHTAIVDQVVEVDEDLMAEYLEKGEVSIEKLEPAFKRAMREGHLVPICFTSARTNVGIKELMEMFVHLLPNPLQGNPRVFEYVKPGSTERQEFRATPDSKKPLVAHVFKVLSDPYVGKLAVFRVHQGHVGADFQPLVDGGRKGVRIAHVFKLRGKDHTEIKQVIAGDIAAVSKIDEIHYNSVLHTGEIGEDLRLRPLPLPKPMYGLAIEGKSKGSETKLAEALHKLIAEDPTFTMERVQATGQTVIRGLGEQHLRMKLRLLKDRYGVDVDSKMPKVAYKETITAKAEGHHRHKKQTGGAGQFGEVYLRVEPLAAPTETGEMFEFVDDTFGGSVPKQFLPAIEKGIRQVLTTGAIAGYPMHGIRVAVYDGKHHPVDSKEVAFITAGKRAFIDAVSKARPVLLEPFVKLEITVPADQIGDISSDLSAKRGRILGTDMLPGNQAVVQAEAPLSEVMTYSAQLKSITGGAGSYSMEYSHDENTPPNVQAEVVAQFKPHHEED